METDTLVVTVSLTAVVPSLSIVEVATEILLLWVVSVVSEIIGRSGGVWLMRFCKYGLFHIPTPAMIAAQSPDTAKAVFL